MSENSNDTKKDEFMTTLKNIWIVEFSKFGLVLLDKVSSISKDANLATNASIKTHTIFLTLCVDLCTNIIQYIKDSTLTPHPAVSVVSGGGGRGGGPENMTTQIFAKLFKIILIFLLLSSLVGMPKPDNSRSLVEYTSPLPTPPTEESIYDHTQGTQETDFTSVSEESDNNLNIGSLTTTLAVNFNSGQGLLTKPDNDVNDDDAEAIPYEIFVKNTGYDDPTDQTILAKMGKFAHSTINFFTESSESAAIRGALNQYFTSQKDMENLFEDQCIKNQNMNTMGEDISTCVDPFHERIRVVYNPATTTYEFNINVETAQSSKLIEFVDTRSSSFMSNLPSVLRAQLNQKGFQGNDMQFSDVIRQINIHTEINNRLLLLLDDKYLKTQILTITGEFSKFLGELTVNTVGSYSIPITDNVADFMVKNLISNYSQLLLVMFSIFMLYKALSKFISSYFSSNKQLVTTSPQSAQSQQQQQQQQQQPQSSEIVEMRKIIDDQRKIITDYQQLISRISGAPLAITSGPGLPQTLTIQDQETETHGGKKIKRNRRHKTVRKQKLHKKRKTTLKHKKRKVNKTRTKRRQKMSTHKYKKAK